MTKRPARPIEVRDQRSANRGSEVRKAPAVKETLGYAGFAELRIVRPEAYALVVARDCDDAAIVQDMGHPEIIDQVVVIEFAAV